MEDWYYLQGEQQLGPYSTEQMRQFIAAGQLNGNEAVRKDGMAQWAPLSTVPDFAGLRFSPDAALSRLNYATPAADRFRTEVLATALSLQLLFQTRSWVRMVSVILYVASGLMIISGIKMFVLGADMDNSVDTVLAFLFAGLGVVYMVPAYFLSRYASSISRLSKCRRDGDLESALRWQKSFWKFSAIFTLIVVGLYLILILLATLGELGF